MLKAVLLTRPAEIKPMVKFLTAAYYTDKRTKECAPFIFMMHSKYDISLGNRDPRHRFYKICSGTTDLAYALACHKEYDWDKGSPYMIAITKEQALPIAATTILKEAIEAMPWKPKD